MSASIEIASLLDALPNAINKINSLSNLRILLSSATPDTLSAVVPNTSFDVIFEFLQSKDSELVGVSCEVLLVLMQAIKPSALLDQFHAELLAGLCNQNEVVKQACLKQLLRVAAQCPQQLALHTDMVVQTAEVLGDDSLPVAKQAEHILSTLAQNSEGLACVFQQEVVDKLYEVCQISTTTRFRVYETIVRLTCQSEEALANCLRTGFMQQLINEVYHDDLLTQLNSLQLLTDLVLTSHGLKYLSEQGVVNRLEEMLVRARSDAIAGFLLPGLVKFFGNVASVFPKEVCGRFKDFIQLVFDLMQGPDVALAALAAETLGVIGGSLEGKLALEKLGGQMLIAMKMMGGLITSGPSEIRTRVMDVVSVLMTLHGEMQTTELLGLTEQWFKNLMPAPLEALLDICRQPFQNLRVHAFGVVCVIANLPWGQYLLASQNGFIDYVLDRSTETTQEGKQCKYDIIKTLAESPTTRSICTSPVHLQFRMYVNDGPYYVRTEALVATEGD